MSFSTSLATTCQSLNNEACTTRPTLIDFNPVKLKYYSSMISLGKWIGICNVFLSPKIRLPKDINFKTFNTITNKNEAKTITMSISCDCKCKFNSATCN